MSIPFRPISISLSPNVEKDDVKLALRTMLKPWIWKGGKDVLLLENRFREYLKAKHAISFNSGRSALMAILKNLGLREGDEILSQAFTCNASVNPVIWLKLKPVYVDCSDDFNMDTEDLKRKITPKSKVLIIQHTFGNPAEMDELLEIAEANNLIIIEDCAHSLGSEYKGKKTGTFGKASFFSFSRDKVISSVYGGMAVTNDDNLAERIRKENVSFPGLGWIFQQLLHPVLLSYLILPVYNFVDLGKAFLVFSQALHILSKAVHWKEKRGERPSYFPKKLPNVLAKLALNQLEKLDKFNNHRKKIADYYEDFLKESSFVLPEISSSAKPVFLRYAVKHKKAHEIIYEAWNKHNILIGDWYTSPIAPEDTSLEKMQYVSGSCPNAERLSKITLNLPTHINIKEGELERISNFLNKYK
ncbi:MAG: hypothetical protein A2365_01415 [Candidatus Nealsonbacteria bacterium RIFOXYB1_FULL_40_15]|uniref:DegT/DnrJ/EryC1/StrS aminotransferase n=2 Tax=Candidatus Nealsoniibacteriota TaxID=1817911 RepID=A0A1G2EQ01_9BACT|nr:MAG: hypothetical protein A2365_01415 [Candidatus Nealsonbacteria bacterium RIFOXYB1_FULL_40_15]OGZ27875.1 MAG: hypothetical protein A2427_04145 [Candidatus Nealsonbacteria bacterium RIFOXYC1_FULL_40_7]OGZ28034.1 MAG: hypothetical protein A2562_01495 [Candidatus Nealsonbacteria bacterium RIFOXYD1_FULL_39_11]